MIYSDSRALKRAEARVSRVESREPSSRAIAVPRPSAATAWIFAAGRPPPSSMVRAASLAWRPAACSRPSQKPR